MDFFRGIIGHKRIQEVLSRMVSHNTLPHALLFVGAKGVGKSTISQAFIRQLLDYRGDLATHPDYLELERLVDEKTQKRKSAISVKQVRELIKRLASSSFSGGWKVVFIQEAEYFSLGAANALLKSLEEPKGKTLFILCTTAEERLPKTIVSRCQVLRFSSVAKNNIQEGLLKMGFAPADASLATAQAFGCPGRALRFLKDSAYKSEVEAGIGQAVRFFSASLPERLAQVMELIPKSTTDKQEALRSLLSRWEMVCRDVLLRQMGAQDLTAFPNEESLNGLVNTYTPSDITNVFITLREVREATRQSVNPHLALEHIALSL